LGGYLGRPPAEVEIRAGSRGKPSLAGGDAGDLRFNLSHSGEMGLYAFRLGAEVGIDIERSGRVRLDDVASAGFLSLGEKRGLAHLEGQSRQEALLRCWTRKEAYIKATGEGMAAPLTEIEVSVAPGASRLRRWMADGDAECGWDLVDLDVGPGYAACLAMEGVAILRTWEWRWP
jgi:4'-phosphopantetheinyl transferase